MPDLDLTPQRAASIAAMAMRRRPTPTFHDVALTGPQRALATFQQLQPRLAGRFADSALLVAANRPKRAATAQLVCQWHLARAFASRWGLPAPKWTAEHRALLGKPCGPACRQAILPRPPKPKPKPQPVARRRRPAAGQPAGRQQHPAHLVASAGRPRPLPPKLAAYNRAACQRLGIDPARYPHLTGARK
jgi:hypothetical protein